MVIINRRKRVTGTRGIPTAASSNVMVDMPLGGFLFPSRLVTIRRKTGGSSRSLDGGGECGQREEERKGAQKLSR